MDHSEEQIHITLNDFSPVMEEAFNSGRVFIFSPRGNSMLPLLRGGCDYVALRRSSEYHRGDIVLFIRKNGKYVLHRIVDIKENQYVLCGDRQWTLEKNIDFEQIVACVCSFYRYKDSWIPFLRKKNDFSLEQLQKKNNIHSSLFRKYDCQTSWSYHCYCYVWYLLFPFRRYIVWLIYLIWPGIIDHNSSFSSEKESKTSYRE